MVLSSGAALPFYSLLVVAADLDANFTCASPAALKLTATTRGSHNSTIAAAGEFPAGMASTDADHNSGRASTQSACFAPSDHTDAEGGAIFNRHRAEPTFPA